MKANRIICQNEMLLEGFDFRVEVVEVIRKCAAIFFCLISHGNLLRPMLFLNSRVCCLLL